MMIKARKIFSILFVFVFAFSVALSALASSGTSGIVMGRPLRRYEDISRVTEAEMAAIEKIKASRDSLRFAALQSTEAFTTDDAEMSSFVSLLCSRFSELFGIPFEMVLCQDPQDLLRSADSDFVYGSLPLSEAARTQITVPIQNKVHIFRKITAVPIENLLIQGDTPRIAFLEDSPLVNAVRAAASYSFDTVYVTSYEDARRRLQEETIDAFIRESTAEVYFNQYPGISSREFLPLQYVSNTISIESDEFAPFLSVIEKYFTNQGMSQVITLYRTGQLHYTTHRLSLHLTDEEKDFIRKHLNEDLPIYFAASADNYPVCYYNKTTQKHEGIAIDVLNQISALTDLRFLPQEDVTAPWYQLLAALEKEEFSFASELLITPARQQSGLFLWPDNAYSSDEYILISKIGKERALPGNLSQYRIGLLRDMGYTEAFKSWFPNMANSKEYQTYQEGYQALWDNEIDYLMGTKNLLLNYSNFLGSYGLEASYVFDYNSQSIFGFNRSESILCSIFSKAQTLVNTSDIETHWKLKSYDYSAEIQRSMMTIMLSIGGVVIAAILFFSLFSIRSSTKKHKKDKTQLETLVAQRTAELETQTVAAQVASQAKTNFLARMSHELRTPMNAILGMSSIAQQASEPESKAYNTIGNVITSAGHLLALLNDILDISNIESDHITLAEKPFQLNDAMLDLCNIFTDRCAEKDLLFLHNLDGLPPLSVLGDKLRLKQVLANLLNNAVNFTPQNGTIHFSVSNQPESDTHALLHFSVQDTGIGIAADRLNQLFLPYEKASQLGGTGLGLSISQKLIQLMGGEIAVASQEDSGSTFSFSLTLPLCEPIVSGTEITQASDLNLSKNRILIVDDTEMNRLILMELLSGTNASMEEAVDGVEAYKMFSESPPHYFDLIFMDIRMPNMNGYEATESIRRLDRPDAQTIPIIAISANAFPEDIEQSLASGMNQHIAKPIQLKTILQALSDHLT